MRSSAPRQGRSPDVRPIGGAGGSSGISNKSAGGAYEAPDTLESDQVARFIDLLSEGELEGWATPDAPLQSIYLNGVPIQNADGSFNFNGLNVQYTSGTPDQEPLPGFADVETLVTVGSQLFHSAPLVQEITDPDADRVVVTLQLPSLYQVSASNGAITGAAVEILIEVQPNGGSYATAVSDTISGKTSASYNQSYNVPLTGAAPWNVRVTRVSADSTTVDLQNETFWSSYTIIQDFALIYPNSALVGIEADALLFGTTIPSRSYLLLGVKISIPSNYDPIRRTYSGVWDGTFQCAWTNNPAWWFYELVTNPRWGLGQYVGASMVDKYTLYAIAQYCDGLVPDGNGGQEPRYTFNAVIAKQEDAIRVLTTMASVFRGMTYWGTAGVTATADMPDDPVKLLAPANVIGGEFTYAGAGLRSRHTVAYVTWFNPSLNYQQDILVVPIDQVEPGCNDIQIFGWRPISFVAFGCTSRGQAYRMGAWLLYTEKNEGEVATWTGAWDQVDLAPGNLVLIADPAYAGVRFGGRIAGVALNGVGAPIGVTLDAPITIESGQTYTLSAVLPHGTIGEAVITNAPGSVAALTLATPLPEVPLVGAMWVVSASNTAPRQFRIVSRTDKAKNEFEFTAIFNDPTKYAQIEQGITLTPPSYTALPTGPLPAPTNLTAIEGVTLAGGTTATAQCVVSWTPPADPRITAYNLQILRPGSTAWELADQVSGPSYDFLGLTPGDYSFRVQAVDAIGDVSPWLEADNAIAALSAPPAAITNLVFAYISERASLNWTDITDPRPYRYEIRKGGATAATSAQIGDVAHPPFTTLGDGTYFVAAYVGPTSAKIYGSWVSIDIVGSVLIDNLVASRDEVATGWTGAFSGAASKSGSDAISPGTGFYASPTVVTLAGITPVRFNVTLAGIGQPIGANELSDTSVLTNPDILGAASTQFVSMTPMIRLSNTGPVSATSNTNWGPWQPWTPDVQNTMYGQLGLAFATTETTVEAVATAFSWTADVDDRIDSYSGLSIPTTGYALTFKQNGAASPFNGGPDGDTYPHVAPYVTNPQAGDVVTASSITLSGCTITVTNGGSGVSRTGGALVAGY